jgi:hypothetical protein
LTPTQIHDQGFLRHKAERIIGKTYKYKKVEPKTNSVQPQISKNAIGPNGYPSAGCSSAEPESVSPCSCKYKLKNEIAFN